MILPEARWRRIGIILGFWTVVALISSAYWFFTHNQLARGPWTVTTLILAKLSVWYLWALFTLVILRLGRRFGPDRLDWARWFIAHLAISLFTILIFMSLLYTIVILFIGSPDTLIQFKSLASILTNNNMSYFYLAYWVTIGIDYTIRYYKRFRESELEASELRTHLAEAKLSALRAQLQPHFLFNTLQTVSDLMHVDVEAADKMVESLGDILRHTIDTAEKQEVTVRSELEFTRKYLSIYEVRYKGRLSVQYNIEPETFNLIVPSIILQPLVENTIRHAVEKTDHEIRLSISASSIEGQLELTIEDDGPGLPLNWSSVEESGIGIANVRKRLNQLYGSEGVLEIHNGGTGGVHTILRLPRSQNNFSKSADTL